MKKFNIVLTTVLACVLCLLCITGNTFSWFSRPKELEGNQLDFSNTYASSVKDNISFVTYESSDGVTYDTTPVTNFSESSGVNSGARKYYRTDIINTGANPQSVSLFLESLTKGANCDGIALGVNGPSKTYKYLWVNGTDKVKSDIYLQNVYVAIHKDENIENQIEKIEYWNYEGLSGSVAWNDSTGKRWYLDGQTANFNPVNEGHWSNKMQAFNIHRLTISAKATKMKLKRYDAWVDTEVQIFSDDNYKNNYIVNNTLYFYEYGGNYFVGGGTSGEHARLHTFYSSASVLAGNTIDLKATAWGKSITYTSSDESVATVDSNGLVTAKNAGTATITVKVYGPYGTEDYLSATCNLTVNALAGDTISNIPIATNMRIEGATDSENGVTSVYWYIKNDSGNDGMTYTIPEVYLTL